MTTRVNGYRKSPAKLWMPLSRFTFVVKAPGYSPDVHRATLASEHIQAHASVESRNAYSLIRHWTSLT
jgi:hypothetical protein